MKAQFRPTQLAQLAAQAASHSMVRPKAPQQLQPKAFVPKPVEPRYPKPVPQPQRPKADFSAMAGALAGIAAGHHPKPYAPKPQTSGNWQQAAAQAGQALGAAPRSITNRLVKPRR